MDISENPTNYSDETVIDARVSKHLGPWLKSRNVTLLVSSYQSGLVLMIGSNDKGKVIINHHKFNRAMGLACDRGGFSLGTLHQIWRFSAIRASTKEGSASQSLVPEVSHVTGFVNCHDIARPTGGGALFASSLFNCVGLAQGEHSFTPFWRPFFIKEFVAEDRCHLNGLAMDGGRLRFVSALGQTNSKAAWRKDRSKGVVMDVVTNKVIAADLWMPHSPRINSRSLWLHVSGTGSFGRFERGKFVEKLLCPGFPRGLGFYDDIAAIGVSKPRATSIDGLPLQERLKSRGIEPRAGVLFFDTRENKVIHSIEFPDSVSEIYDVGFLRGVHNASLIHPNSPEVGRTYAISLGRKRDPDDKITKKKALKH